MEPDPIQAAEALEKIDEVRRYYGACETLSGPALRMSKSMLLFVLGCRDPASIDPVLAELQRQGQLAAVLDDEVVFAPLAASLAG